MPEGLVSVLRTLKTLYEKQGLQGSGMVGVSEAVNQSPLHVCDQI